MESNKILLKVTKEGKAISAQMLANPIKSVEAIGHACLTFVNMAMEAGELDREEAVEALFAGIGIYTLKAEDLVDDKQREAVLELRRAVDMYLRREEE